MADENSRRFPRQWWVLALFAVAAGVAVWQQFVIGAVIIAAVVLERGMEKIAVETV